MVECCWFRAMIWTGDIRTWLDSCERGARRGIVGAKKKSHGVFFSFSSHAGQ